MWLDDDQDKALAWIDYQRRERNRRCPSCGTRPDELVDPVSKRPWTEPGWVVEVSECPGCALVASARATIDPGARESAYVSLRSSTPTDFVRDDE